MSTNTTPTLEGGVERTTYYCNYLKVIAAIRVLQKVKSWFQEIYVGRS